MRRFFLFLSQGNKIKPFGIVTTVHKDVSERLKYVDRQLYQEVKTVLDTNKAQRHIRGGMATRRKYKKDCDDSLQPSGAPPS
ncbi:sporulation transcriptional regulator SpoIIID [Solibaculum mannosilyticum]|uniref:sporulation transcriptional regulator SpoIIID n=1 Tax=Solibaculum mannosilyticum TaxID=2780922 RepID=UPI0036F2677C